MSAIIIDEDFDFFDESGVTASDPRRSASVYSARSFPIQPVQTVYGQVFTEDVGYLTLPQQLKRFQDAGLTLSDIYRKESLKNYQFLDGVDSGDEVSWLTRSQTELDVLDRAKRLLSSYSEKFEANRLNRSFETSSSNRDENLGPQSPNSPTVSATDKSETSE